MIELSVKPYCHNCNRFEADVRCETLYGGVHWDTGKEICVCNTTVKCTHRAECSQIFQYLEEEFEKTKGANE